MRSEGCSFPGQPFVFEIMYLFCKCKFVVIFLLEPFSLLSLYKIVPFVLQLTAVKNFLQRIIYVPKAYKPGQ